MEKLDIEYQEEEQKVINVFLRLFYRVQIILRRVPTIHSLLSFLLPFGLIFIIWALVAWAKIYPDYLFPSPFHVISRSVEMTMSGEVFRHIGASMFRLGLGFIVGFFTALPLGILIGVNKASSDFFTPPITFFQAIPGLAWVPLAILWLGIGHKAVTFIIFNSVFFPIIFNTILGIRSIPENTINAALCMGASHWVLVKEVYIPGALPSIVTGIRLGVGYGWRALIGGEMIATASGLGFMIFDARQFLGTDVVILGMVLIGLLWIIIDSLLLKPLEKRTIFRWGTVRS
jgi:NitT/TauT family transport system permease protein/taurine transport system permease protein